MKIISDYTQDTRTPKPEPGSYEWWYFDALSDSGDTGLVVIFYEGNPFSANYHLANQARSAVTDEPARSFPALSVSLYHNQKPIYYGFQEVTRENASFQETEIRGSVGRSSFCGTPAGDRLEYRLALDQELVSGDRIRGELTFTSDILKLPDGEEEHGDSDTENGGVSGSESGGTGPGRADGEGHVWNLVQPRAVVAGRLELTGYEKKTISFSGTGYHDHNLGKEPMDRSFRDWYWGRFHLSGHTFLYYVMNLKNGERQYRGWILDEGGKVTAVDREVAPGDTGYSLFGLRSARLLSFSGGGYRVTVQQEKLLDNGPFYQRFFSRVLIEDGSRLYSGGGITEYLMPARIHNPLFRPLVNMRIDYPGRGSHWVQRNPRLYRWTWQGR